MAATTLMLSVVVIDALRRMGFRVSAREGEAVVHLWRYAGYLLGVEPELLCATEAEARRLADLIASTTRQPDEDSRCLMQALMESPLVASLPQLQRLSGLYHAIAHSLLGPDTARSLGVQLSQLSSVVVPALRLAVSAGETLRCVVPRATRLAIAAGDKLWDATLTAGLAAETSEYTTVTDT